MKIQNSVALVTGANRGLGLSFAKALLERGARKVYAAARDPATVTLPGVVPLQLDVTNADSLATLAARAPDVSLLINNAGIVRAGGAVGDDALARARAEMETNYFGPLATSHALAPVLAKQGGGAILNVLSVLAWVTTPRVTTYSASKAAAWMLSNGLRHELREQGTQVVGLHVGYIDTDMTRGIDAPKVRPEDVVRSALDGLESGAEEVLADHWSEKVKQALSAGAYLGLPG